MRPAELSPWPAVTSLTSGFGRAFMTAAGIMLLAALITDGYARLVSVR